MKKYLGVLFAVLLTVSCLVVPALAEDDSFNPDSDLFPYCTEHSTPFYSAWDYVVYNDGNNLRCFAYKSGSFSVLHDVSASSPKIRFECVSQSSSLYMYSLIFSKGCWSVSSAYPTSQITAHDAFYSDLTIYTTTVDIYDSNGELFFQVPPAPQPGLGETVEALTLTQGEAVRNQAVGVMKILAPCGVGCLALLMVFPALKKGLFRFLT